MQQKSILRDERCGHSGRCGGSLQKKNHTCVHTRIIQPRAINSTPAMAKKFMYFLRRCAYIFSMHTLSKRAYILAISLSALAGCVDAIGFLQLGGHFISFMSGNSTQLAAGMVAGEWHAAALLGGIIALFVTGTMLGVWVRHFSKAPASAVLACVTFLLATAAASHSAGIDTLAIACMTLAMGAENAVFHRNGDVVVGLTYMTGTLVKFGQRLAHATLGGPRFAWAPYLFLWLGLLLGGASGAALFYYLGLYSLCIPAIWAGLLTLATHHTKISLE